MFKLAISIFMILHGLVHLLYVGQSQRVFELQSGMVWPDGSWTFSRIMGDETTRLVASVFLVLAAIGFVVSGAGLYFEQAWWRTAVAGVSVFSSIIYIVMWNGKMQHLDNQGAIGILINIALIVVAVVAKF